MSEGVSKFSAENGEAKVDIGDSGDCLVGLSKAEVMKYATNPTWIMLRRTLFFLFWAIWVAMLVGAIFIIIVTPRCQKGLDPKWFEKSPIYTIRVDSFADSDGDGAGDLAGLTDKLDYIKHEISINAIALEGLLEKSDLHAIQGRQGSENDFKNLASQIKVILKLPLVPEVDLEKLRKWAELGAAGFILEEFDDMSSQYYEAMPRWRQTIFNTSDSPDSKLLALSSSQFNQLREEHCNHVDMILNYDMIRLPQAFMSTDLHAALGETHTSKCRTNFVLGMANVSPFVTRFEPRSLMEALLIFNLLSDSTPIVYYGDEYGKRDTSSEPKSRNIVPMPDPRTGLMDWIDLARVRIDSAPSIYKVFTAAAKLRKLEASIYQGSTSLRESDSVLSMSRVKIGYPGFVVVSNFATEKKTINLLTTVSRLIPENGNVAMTSTNSKHLKDEKLKLNELSIEAGETLVIEFVPEKET
ncbi:4F2 cell-surface antigen heavy chain [Galendromus occidentalis]|uniref:4F2 cell-surface antigen heavy chain n=1 Tax=Galendromus occidentalis TaxID=34638 RepID=A0AAJ6QQ90_9ACAR|nr:4F2 cell-surface antigen heavy chain [Galendromus occidentalis]